VKYRVVYTSKWPEDEWTLLVTVDTIGEGLLVMRMFKSPSSYCFVEQDTQVPLGRALSVLCMHSNGRLEAWNEGREYMGASRDGLDAG
jgi:hypothetical protein